MAQYYGEYSCGHDGYVDIIGPSKDRQRKADYRFSGLCPDCYKEKLDREREKANAEAAEKAKEMELPELTGSEKQIAWGNTLRQKFIDNVEVILESENTKDHIKDEVISIRDYILENKTDATFYIDNRDERIKKILKDFRELAAKPKEVIKEEKQILEDIEAEALVVPEKAHTNAAATIKEADGEVVAMFEKDTDFIEIVKNLGYSWDAGWRKRISYTTGTATERIAELGNKLLDAGYPVKIYDPAARQKAIDADYEPEHTRWVYVRNTGTYEGWLVIKWEGRSDRLYKAARSLRGSKWDNGVVVKVDKFDEVEEFAELFDFKFTPAATREIDKYKQTLETNVVTPAEPKSIEHTDGLEEILNSSREILDDLKDD